MHSIYRDIYPIISTLYSEGASLSQIAGFVNHKGYVSITGKLYSPQLVHYLIKKFGLPMPSTGYRNRDYYARKAMSFIEEQRILGRRYTDIADDLNEMGYRTLRGKYYNSTHINRLKKKYGFQQPCEAIDSPDSPDSPDSLYHKK